MDKEEFKYWYCYGSGITLEEFDRHFVILPCKCSDPDCDGWAAVSNHPVAIKVHIELYGA